jgi:hypothetical protein
LGTSTPAPRVESPTDDAAGQAKTPYARVVRREGEPYRQFAARRRAEQQRKRYEQQERDLELAVDERLEREKREERASWNWWL